MTIPTPLAYRRYLLGLAATLAVAAALVLAIVVLVDPYGLYRVLQRPGFNAVKPGLTRYQEAIKLSNALALKPQLLILGNSRAEIGFDPAAAPGRYQGLPAYNLAIPGTGLQSSRRELLALHAHGVRPATLVVGVEFLDFLAPAAARPGAPPGFEPIDLGQLAWRADALFSLATLKDALRTVRIQHDGEAATIAANGFNPLHEYLAYARNDGYQVLFEQAAQSSRKALQKKLPAVLSADDFAHLRAILQAASASGAEVELVVYPYHARMLLMFEELGLWPLFEQWKAQLAAEVAASRRVLPAAQLRLTDFSGFGPYQCEPVPARQARTQATAWYWEAGHFKKELGTLMLQRLLAPQPDANASFGMALDSGNLAANAARIARERAQCQQQQPALFGAAATLAAGPGAANWVSPAKRLQ